METLRVGNFEYRMLSAGDWELGRLHDYILEQRQQGWELDTAFGLEEAAGEGGPAALQLWLRRERSSRLRAS